MNPGHARAWPGAPGPASRLVSLLVALLAALLLGACAGAPERSPSPTQALATTATEQAARALRRGDLAQARTQYLRGLAAAQALQAPTLEGAALLNLTLVSARLGDLAAAHGYVDRILDAPAYFDAPLQARAAARKALLWLDADRLDEALQAVEQAERRCPPPCALAATLDNVRAYAALQRGDAGAAATLARRAAAQAAGAAQLSEQAGALRLLARVLTRLGDTTAAGAALDQALQLDRQLGEPDRIALDLLYSAENEARRGNRPLALDFCARAVTVYRAAGDARRAAALHHCPDGP